MMSGESASSATIIGSAVQAYLIAGAVNAALQGERRAIDYAELATYLVVGYTLGYFGGMEPLQTLRQLPSRGELP